MTSIINTKVINMMPSATNRFRIGKVIKLKDKITIRYESSKDNDNNEEEEIDIESFNRYFIKYDIQ